MADGAGGAGGFGGTLFEATKKVVAGQVQATTQAIGQQVTGKPAPGQQKAGAFNFPQGGGANTATMPGLDNFGDFSSLFEKNQLVGQKPPPPPPTSQNKTPQQLQQMA